MRNWTRPGGCRDQILECQAALRDEHGEATPYLHQRGHQGRRHNPKNLTLLCGERSNECEESVFGLYMSTLPALPPSEAPYNGTRGGFYDIAHPARDPFPAPHLHGYLAEADTLRALGVPVNYSASSDAVYRAFTGDRRGSFDVVAGGFVEALGTLLDEGDGENEGDAPGHRVAVHLVYGDRDYACNWVGGEAVSLAVPWLGQDVFVKEAGYAPLVVPGTTDFQPDENTMGGKKAKRPSAHHNAPVQQQEGGGREWAGMTRQAGPFSFTRVFQSGHEIPSYQPAAAYAVFMRATRGVDIATGTVDVEAAEREAAWRRARGAGRGERRRRESGRRSTPDDYYRTTGPKSTWHLDNEPPQPVTPRCYVLKPASCTKEVWERVKSGKAVIKDWFVVEDDDGEKKDGRQRHEGDGSGRRQQVLDEL